MFLKVRLFYIRGTYIKASCGDSIPVMFCQNDNWTSGCFTMYILLVHDMWWKAMSCIPVQDWGNKCTVQFWVITCSLFVNLCLCHLFKHKHKSSCLQDFGFSFKNSLAEECFLFSAYSTRCFLRIQLGSSQSRSLLIHHVVFLNNKFFALFD